MLAFEKILNHPDLVPLAAIVMGVGAGIIWIIFATIYYTARVKAREQTRREIAAYVAEGSMDAKTAVAILNAGPAESDEVREVCDIFGGEKQHAATPA